MALHHFHRVRSSYSKFVRKNLSEYNLFLFESAWAWLALDFYSNCDYRFGSMSLSYGISL
jgi:hypothetical protein